MTLPKHIAIIMDGNGRWGLSKFKSRLKGHEYGIKNIKKIIYYCLKIGIKNLTLYSLSYDNLKKRNRKEVNNLFFLLETYLHQNLENFRSNKIMLNFIGEKKNLPKKILNLLKIYKDKTYKKKRKLLINIAFNYSSKKEILNALKKIGKDKNKINIYNFEKNLYTSLSGNLDFIIRTGGFNRLSDFLLWQCSYSEIFFLKKLWPDFKVSDLKKIINKYKTIKKNYGS